MAPNNNQALENVAIYRTSLSGPGHSKMLARDLGAHIVTFRHPPPESAKLIFNYGRIKVPEWHHDGLTWLNWPELIRNASDKARSWALLDDLGIPRVQHTLDIDRASGWLSEDGKLYSRATLRGRRGEGITVVRAGETIPPGETYVRAFPVHKEFRVHVFGNDIIDITQKRRRNDDKLIAMGLTKGANMDVRNLKGGWIYARRNIAPSEHVKVVAINAVKATGLDFAAADILMDRGGNAVICEINSAPGLRGTTRASYGEAIRRLADES